MCNPCWYLFPASILTTLSTGVLFEVRVKSHIWLVFPLEPFSSYVPSQCVCWSMQCVNPSLCLESVYMNGYLKWEKLIYFVVVVFFVFFMYTHLFLFLVPKMYSTFKLYPMSNTKGSVQEPCFSWLTHFVVAVNFCKGNICMYALTFHYNRLKFLIYVWKKSLSVLICHTGVIQYIHMEHTSTGLREGRT